MGLFARPSAYDVLEQCAPYLDGDREVLAFVVGRTSTSRLLYVVTERAVHVIRLGPALTELLSGRLAPREQLRSDPCGEVEVESGIASVRVGAYRAKVRLADRARAAEVVRWAAGRPG